MTAFLAKALYFLRITDETGTLSLTHGFLVLAAVVYLLHPDAVTAATAAAAVANYALAKKALPFMQQALGARHADAAMSRDADLKKVEVAADVKTTQAQIAKLAEAVKELATPERLAAIREMRTGTGPSLRPPSRL